MAKYCSDNNLSPDNNMFGVYAARRYESHEVISVYVGKSLGHTNGTIDNNKKVMIQCRK